MKSILSAAIIVLSILTLQNAYAFTDFSKRSHGNSTASIDVNDTVVFDISQSQMAGNKVSFPVYILTDDTINALDFSFQYDEMNFSFDSIIIQSNLESIHNDTLGTIYFSSYSLQEIPHNTNLLTISLNMLGHYLCSDDLDSFLVYLNGDACSVKVVECLSDAVHENTSSVANAYPNPATDLLNVSCSPNAFVQLLDVKGSVVFSGINDSGKPTMAIDLSRVEKGMYVLSVHENEKVFFQKIVVE